jgi:hypothetical protein
MHAKQRIILFSGNLLGNYSSIYEYLAGIGDFYSSKQKYVIVLGNEIVVDMNRDSIVEDSGLKTF